MSVTTATPLSLCCRIISPALSWNADSGPQVQPTIVVDQLALAVVVFLTPRERLLSPLSIDTVAQFFRRHGLTSLLVASRPLQRKAVVELDLQSTSSPAPTSPRVWPSGRSVPSLGNLMLAGVDLEQVVPNIESDRWSREYQRARELLDSAGVLSFAAY